MKINSMTAFIIIASFLSGLTICLYIYRLVFMYTKKKRVSRFIDRYYEDMHTFIGQDIKDIPQITSEKLQDLLGYQRLSKMQLFFDNLTMQDIISMCEDDKNKYDQLKTYFQKPRPGSTDRPIRSLDF